MAETLPSRIGRYEILAEIGRGAMGVVYEARDTGLMRPVALKTMSLAAAVPEPLRAQFEKRFYQEARAAAGLQHPGIVVVHDIGTDETTKAPYMALELLRGRTLEKLIADEGKQEWKRAAQMAARLADALQHAHSHGIVHRDLKPANVMVLAAGELKIMDFGVAKVEASVLTSQGQVFGSPSYMAPEQALEAKADARSDIFSLGCVLYELLTGQRAFAGRVLSEILMRLAREEPPPPSRLAPGTPADLDAIVAFALAKDPERRYQAAAALAEDIADLLAERRPRHAAARTPASPKEGAQTRVAGSPGAALGLPKGKRVSLAFLSGPRSGEVVVLAHPSALIGRQGAGGGASLELADDQVSRAHAVLECHGTRFVLRDLESRNGTFVNGQRIGQHELDNQGEFQIGASRVMLIVADQE